MSFILDALRKSENERQSQASPHVSVTTVGSNRGWQPGWLALLVTGLGAALLAVAIVWWFLEPATTTTTAATSNSTSPFTDSVDNDPSVRNLSQEARRSGTETVATAAKPVAPRGGESVQQTTSNAQPKKDRGGQPLTITEAMAGGLSLPHMNLDIHVFAPQSAGRFVFINSRKYREGELLREGPTVEGITSDGVILVFQGQRLLLPRD